MFKSFFDSLFIIDAKEKPAPSFLLAYIFTWLVVQYEVTLAFFKTKGDFTTRFNASLNLTNEMEYGLIQVLGITMAVVLFRFILNGAIYYMREYIENKTQHFLINNDHKSPVHYSIFHGQQIKISELQTSLLSSQDREKMAKELEQEASSVKNDLTIARDKYQSELNIQSNENIENQKVIERQSTQKISDDRMTGALEDDIENIMQQNEESKIIIEGLKEHIGTITARLKSWALNANNNDITLINLTNNEETKEVVDKLDKLLTSVVVNRNISSDELDLVLSKIKVTDSPLLPKPGQGLVSGLAQFYNKSKS
jgi:hypothetical protein